MICDNVLEAVGGTPLVRLRRMTGPDNAQVLVKFEAVNVGGSVKTRTALKMIERAEERGELASDSIIVEPTSGNQGVGLALVAAVKGYAARIIMPDSCSVERRRIMEHYGAEVICVHDEEIDFTHPLELFDPAATWKRKVYTNIEARELLVPIFRGGELVYQVPELQTSRAYCQRQVDALWDEVKRFENPHNYYVDLSQKLWDIKQSLLTSHEMA